MTVDKQEARSKGNFWGPAFGVIFTISWVALSSLAFAVLIGVVGPFNQNGVQPYDAAKEIIWPFATISLGVPIIAFVWFGGFMALARLVELREHLKRMDSYVQDFDEMSRRAQNIREQFQQTSDLISESAESESNLQLMMDGIKVQLDTLVAGSSDWRCRFNLDEAAGEPRLPEDEPISNSSVEFNAAYQLAMQAFREFLDRRNANPGRGRSKLFMQKGGWNKIDILKKLQDEGNIPEPIYRVLQNVFEIEERTRRWGRDELDPRELRETRQRLRAAWQQEEQAQ